MITLDREEFLSLYALVEVNKSIKDAKTDPAEIAHDLMRAALADKLEAVDLLWAPSAEEVHSRAARMAEAEPEPGGLRRLLEDERLRRTGIAAIAVVALVLLWGGYIGGWGWTGFRTNDQIWDWLHLLLLPVILGTLPLWIKHREYMSRARQAAYAAGAVAFAVFVIAGYLIPLKWTGFAGQTLWTWFELILLPVATISVKAWPAAGRPVRIYHKIGVALLLFAWAVTLLGGYAAGWHWTGYPGNTLWQWLQLLLLPLVFPTILLPAALKWISGNAAGLAKKAADERKTAVAGA